MKSITSIADLEALPIWIVFDQVPQPDGKKPKKIPYHARNTAQSPRQRSQHLPPLYRGCG